MPNSYESQVIWSISDHHDQPDHCRNDRCMDGVNGSCMAKKLESVSGGNERSLRRKLNDQNQGISCSQDGNGSQSKAQIAASTFVEVEGSTSSSSNSGEIDSDEVVILVKPPQNEDDPTESSNHIALGADDDAQGRAESRVDDHDVENTSTMPGSIVGEGGSVRRLSKSQSSVRMDKGTNKSPKLTQACKIQWPKWTVSHMLSLSTMEKVMNYYRVLNLADKLNDEDLRYFLKEQLSKEKAGLSEKTITNRLRTKLHVSATAGEPDSCSICMVEYKDQEKIASLYYCSHEYHADCIKEWLLKNNLCPMCRALAIIPEVYPSWNGDVRLHQAFFVHLQYAI